MEISKKIDEKVNDHQLAQVLHEIVELCENTIEMLRRFEIRIINLESKPEENFEKETPTS